MRESRPGNLNSVDIYCQGVLIHRHRLLHRLTQHQRAAGSGERHAPLTVLLADSPLRLLLRWKVYPPRPPPSLPHSPQPIGQSGETQGRSPGGMSQIQVLSCGAPRHLHNAFQTMCLPHRPRVTTERIPPFPQHCTESRNIYPVSFFFFSVV